MKKIFSYLIWALVPFIVFSSCQNQDDVRLTKKDRMDLAMQQEYEMTKDDNGNVPRERLIEAVELMKVSNKTTAAIPNISWTNIGPTNQAGRSKTMLLDANDPTGRTVFCGSVGGGIWKTTNIFSNSPNWAPVNDFMQNIAITSIDQDPSAPNILYAATGEPYGSSSSIRGLGVFKSTDGGNTWNQLAATNNSNFYQCAKLMVSSSGHVYVATTQGLYLSSDQGVTFTRVLSSTSPGASSNRAHDVDEAANGNIYASLDGSLHRSTDNGLTWTPITLGFTCERIEIACAMSNPSVLYLLTERTNKVERIVKTTNGGTSWTNLPEPADDDPGIPSSDFSRGQAWYDLCIAVDPNNENVVYVGGIDLFRSGNGGTSWTQISHWYGGFGHQYVHADQHFIGFRKGSSDTLFFCNDGGIYSTVNGSSAVPSIDERGRNMVTLQLYGCDMHPVNPHYLGGAQDNGSHKFSSNALAATVEVTGGDGAFCNIDQDQPNYQFTQYVYNQYRVSSNGGSFFSSVNLSSSLGRFINPSDYDDANNIMYAASSTNKYIRWNNPQTGNNYDNVTVSLGGGKVSAVHVSPNVNNRIYLGDDDGNITRVDNAHANPTATSISTGLPANKYVSCIAVEKGNENHIIITYSNYGTNSVWETVDGGTLWTSVEGNLPDMPVRWAVFNPNDGDQVFLATELGVWSTDNLDGNNTNWAATNTGLANVRVDMIRVNNNKELIAATHGRGMYYSNSLNAGPVNIPVASINVYGQGNVSVITTQGGSLQMIADIIPTNATNQNVIWSVAPGTGTATINATGVLTAQTNGTVIVTATATDGSNVSGSTVITLSNQVPMALADSIDVYGQGRIFTITQPQGKLQMLADVYPTIASQNVLWNMLVGGTGAAALSTNGELTAVANGTVIVQAIATDGSNVSGTAVITITNQAALGNADISLNHIQLFPNPTNGIIKVTAENLVKNVAIFSLTGRYIDTYKAQGVIDLRSLPKGNYGVVITLNNGKRKSQLITVK